MASIRVKSNIGVISERITSRLAILKDREYLLRPVCFDVIDLMTKRIHIDGKNADDKQIGTYSKGYMAVRTGNYANSDKFSKGKNKGANKNAGVVSKRRVDLLYGKTKYVYQNIESDKIARKRYNRSNDPKIIVSLTRQLENDWSVIATDQGYGVGFLNVLNLQKARWVEAGKKQKIFSLSESERNHALSRVQELVKTALSE